MFSVITKNISTDAILFLLYICGHQEIRKLSDNTYEHLTRELFVCYISWASFHKFKLPGRESGHSHFFFLEHTNAWSFFFCSPIHLFAMAVNFLPFTEWWNASTSQGICNWSSYPGRIGNSWCFKGPVVKMCTTRFTTHVLCNSCTQWVCCLCAENKLRFFWRELTCWSW